VSYHTAVVTQEGLLEFIAFTIASRSVTEVEFKACLHMLRCRYYTSCYYQLFKYYVYGSNCTIGYAMLSGTCIVMLCGSTATAA
jgi:hypothetical protein